MDKEVIAILAKYGVPKASIDDLQSALIQAQCIIYKSELPPINRQPIHHVDATPNDDYPLRILRTYRQGCDCRWSDTTNGTDTENPLLKMMNDHCEQRAKILDKAIEKLMK